MGRPPLADAQLQKTRHHAGFFVAATADNGDTPHRKQYAISSRRALRWVDDPRVQGAPRMKQHIACTALSVALVAALLPAGANAQIGDLIKGASQGGQESSGGLGALGNLGGMGGGLPSLGSLSSGSTGNVAGVLEFCVKNNYLSGAGAESVKDRLLGKLGGAPASDPGYMDGTRGILTGANGSTFDLASIKSQITRQACDKILSQGKSLL
jgi:hypothetical protein